jgi:hypothetical protein
MNVQLSVTELIEAFAGTYKSIDVRTAAMKEEDSWVNALAVVRLSHEEPEAAARRLQLVQQRFLRVQTEHFRVNLVTLPFTEWGKFCSGVGAGFLRLNEESINLLPPFDLNEQKGYLRQYDSDFKAIDSIPWPSLRVTRATQNSARFNDSTVLKELAGIGYSSPNEAIDPLFEAANVHQNAFNYDLVLYVPVFALVSEMRIKPSENRLYISLLRHSEISNLRLGLSFHGRGFGRDETPKERKNIGPFAALRKDTPTFEETVVSDIPELVLHDYVRATLLHPAVGEVCSTSDEVCRLVPPVERNILFEVLKRFCPDGQLRQLVSLPQSIKRSKLKESSTFERTVSWLLGLFGFSTIILGEYENLSSQGTEVRLGSIDILASAPTGKTLLLVSCTLGVPKEEDFRNLAHVQALLERHLLPETTCRILPVLFTGARGLNSSTVREGPFASVRIVDAGAMENMLNLVQNGEERQFFAFLDNPTFAGL